MAADLGLPVKNVRSWNHSDSIPAEWFAALARAAPGRGMPEITAEHLADLAERRRKSREAAPAQGAAA